MRRAHPLRTAACLSTGLLAAVVGSVIAAPQRPAEAPTAARPLVVTHRARALQPGEAVLLTIDSAHPLDAVDGTAFGQPLAAFPVDAGTRTRWQALVGIDVESRPGNYRVVVEARGADGFRTRGADTLAVGPRQFGTRRLTVAPEYVTPPPGAQERIVREQAQLAALLSTVTRPPAWQGPFVAPVDGPAANNFGQQSVFNGVPRSRHRGVDFGSPHGTPVVAPNRGRVVLAADLYFTGTTVVLDHGCGVFSLLAHLSQMDVPVGETVERGARVGAVGATGRVTGPHLHWTLRIGGAAVDPLSLLALGDTTPSDRH